MHICGLFSYFFLQLHLTYYHISGCHRTSTESHKFRVSSLINRNYHQYFMCLLRPHICFFRRSWFGFCLVRYMYFWIWPKIERIFFRIKPGVLSQCRCILIQWHFIYLLRFTSYVLKTHATDYHKQRATIVFFKYIAVYATRWLIKDWLNWMNLNWTQL